MSFNPLISFDLFSNKCTYKFENKYLVNEFVDYMNLYKYNKDDVLINNTKIIIKDNSDEYFKLFKKWKNGKMEKLI